MNIGEKIKRIRQHRRMTQKELGELVDLSANRIAQYEMGYRVPKKPLLNQIAEALRVSTLALSDGGNGPANDILEQLFWLDEEQPGVIKLVPTERGTARYNANPDLALHYDDNDNWPPRSPVAMWFDDTILDDFLKDWAAIQKKLYAGRLHKQSILSGRLCGQKHKLWSRNRANINFSLSKKVTVLSSVFDNFF